LVDATYLAGGRVNERFWVLVVRQIDEDHLFNLDDLIRGIHRYGFGNTWRGEPYPLQATEVPIRETEPPTDLDRKNRDPEYWTFERKELLRQEREARLAAMKAREAKDSP
jgi:hypothetical protein